jgi:hypothetical protein
MWDGRLVVWDGCDPWMENSNNKMHSINIKMDGMCGKCSYGCWNGWRVNDIIDGWRRDGFWMSDSFSILNTAKQIHVSELIVATGRSKFIV